MSVGVALYLSGEGRKQIEGAWKRVLAAGFPSPARVPGQRPHVSLVNGEGELPLAHHLGSELAVPLARVDPLACSSQDRKSTRLNSSHITISYAVFCLKKKK